VRSCTLAGCAAHRDKSLPMLPPCVGTCMMPARACDFCTQLGSAGDAHGRCVRQATVSKQWYMGTKPHASHQRITCICICDLSLCLQSLTCSHALEHVERLFKHSCNACSFTQVSQHTPARLRGGSKHADMDLQGYFQSRTRYRLVIADANSRGAYCAHNSVRTTKSSLICGLALRTNRTCLQ
jgi:hypothetical protein